MKVTLTFKTPDVIDQTRDDLSTDEECKRFDEIVSRFFRYGEYCDIELDLGTGEAKVLEI